MSKAKIFNINEVEWKNWGDGIDACVFKPTPHATMQYWEIKAGTGGAPHSHPAEQLTYVQTGIMELTVDGETHVLTPGCFALIPSEAVHSTKNIGSSLVVNVDIFLPERDDREESPKIRSLEK